MPRKRPHPAKAVIVAQGRTILEVSDAIGVNRHTLGRVLNRHIPPWPKLRRQLAQLLDMPESELFLSDDQADVVAAS